MSIIFPFSYFNNPFIIAKCITTNTIQNHIPVAFNQVHSILKHVATLLSGGLFDYYIQRYEYELECFDIGNEIIEKERIGDK